MCQWNCRLFRCSLIVILLTVVLAACQDDVPDVVVVSVEETAVFTPTAQPTATPTFTPSPTPTQTKTAVPTNTSTPNPTSTPTPTRFPELLLMPEAPPTDETAYRLAPWSPDHAHNLALLMEDYFEKAGQYFSSTIVQDIRFGFREYVALSYAEAQLRYPVDSRQNQWEMAEVLNRVVSFTQQNSDPFSDVLIRELNSGNVSFNGAAIEEWFYEFPFYYEFVIQINPVLPLSKFKSSHIVTIASTYVVGGTTFLVQETSDGYFAYPLYNNLGDVDASFYHPSFGDLTGDGIPELLLSIGWHNGSMLGESRFIFDLSVFPPQQLSFGPGYSLFFPLHTSIDSSNTNQSILRVDGGDAGLCPSYYSSTFRWNGQWFEPLIFEDFYDFFSFSACKYALEGSPVFTDFGHRALVEWVEGKIDYTFPDGTDWRTGEPFHPDALDEFRFILAMNHAILGNVVEAQGYLERIINSPSIPESAWIEPAETFLAHYESTGDSYQACAAVNVKCSLRLALEQTASTLKLDEFDEAVEQLVALGVPVVANGRFDFDNNRNPEHWLIVQHQPGGAYELWILAASDVRVKAMFVDIVFTLNPTLLLHTASYPPANDTFQFTIGNDSIYNFIRRLRDQEPYVTKLRAFEPYIYEQPPAEAALDQAIDDLLSGTNPQEILTQLQTLADNPDFEPNNRYYYYLGLTYELLGDEENAVSAYLLAWQDCCDTWQFAEEIVTANPYAIMARAKLEPVP